MKQLVSYFRSEVLPHWRVYATALGVCMAWQSCHEPAQPAYVSEEAEMIETAAKWALGAYVAHEVLESREGCPR